MARRRIDASDGARDQNFRSEPPYLLECATGECSAGFTLLGLGGCGGGVARHRETMAKSCSVCSVSFLPCPRLISTAAAARWTGRSLCPVSPSFLI
jgi:hypothetical protein